MSKGEFLIVPAFSLVTMFKTPQVVLVSRDLAHAADFYRALGFEEVFRTPTEGSLSTSTSLSTGTALVWRARFRRETTTGSTPLLPVNAPP
jgi:catechol 2,3-dioxygenase-like lactoylglutathione lyase family enzyme